MVLHLNTGIPRPTPLYHRAKQVKRQAPRRWISLAGFAVEKSAIRSSGLGAEMMLARDRIFLARTGSQDRHPAALPCFRKPAVMAGQDQSRSPLRIFGFVHGPIRSRQKTGLARTIHGVDGDADTRGTTEQDAFDGKGRIKTVFQALGDLFHLNPVVHIRKQGRKLVAAQASQLISAAKLSLHAF